MNKGLLAVLVLLAVVAGFVLVPRLLKKPHQPPLEGQRQTVSWDTRLRCAHCRAEFAVKDAKAAPANQALVLCPRCKKPTPRAPAKR